jgi:hypothetical protein
VSAAALRRRLGLPEPTAVYWTPDPDHPVTRKCTRCRLEKHLMDFHLSYDRGRRLRQCKTCRRAAYRRYYAAHADRLRAAALRYYHDHTEPCRATQTRYREKHPDRLREARRRYDAAHRQRRRATRRRWAARNPDRVRANRRRYRDRHPTETAIRHATQLLRRAGLLPLDPACARCGRPATDHHHLNYRDPCAVASLCHRCHMRLHHDQWRKDKRGPHAPRPPRPDRSCQEETGWRDQEKEGKRDLMAGKSKSGRCRPAITFRS